MTTSPPMTDDAPDSRIQEQRLAALWARATASMDLVEILDALYHHEINVGMQSFYDGGWKVWLGDEMNGHKSEFLADEAGAVALGLWKTAEDHYPALKTGRLRMAMANG